uniref:Rod shape-determining protein MreD n=2 Tax=unclassified Candidatus Kentrum TaxID=2643149 RepID=A0A451B2Z0_9GAMM|nr:MAG: rod shape-determining protein MreD [Candidatus Kentron sp. LPFa]VFK67306.1 MAG: rod shape-determining protein MreD [Candidatus Kentron sp. UNK]VFK72650.1 MAG: rod shape-determining protein MreD [Candidatus Kentron sp. UNK]
MSLAKHHGAWIITITFLITFVLVQLPIPDWAAIWRPSWVAIVLIYWCLAVPKRIGVGAGWLVGLTLDVLGGGLLGQHALGLCIVAFIVGKFHQQIRVLPIWQQGLGVFVVITLYQLLILWFNGIQGHPVPKWAYISSALTSALIWPWAFIILRDIRRKYQID